MNACSWRGTNWHVSVREPTRFQTAAGLHSSCSQQNQNPLDCCKYILYGFVYVVMRGKEPSPKRRVRVLVACKRREFSRIYMAREWFGWVWAGHLLRPRPIELLYTTPYTECFQILVLSTSIYFPCSIFPLTIYLKPGIARCPFLLPSFASSFSCFSPSSSSSSKSSSFFVVPTFIVLLKRLW